VKITDDIELVFILSSYYKWRKCLINGLGRLAEPFLLMLHKATIIE